MRAGSPLQSIPCTHGADHAVVKRDIYGVPSRVAKFYPILHF